MHIGVFGLSGVGKTTFSKSFHANHKDFFCTSASDIIKKDGCLISAKSMSYESMLANQATLANAYGTIKSKYDNTLVEFHCVVEGQDGLLWIPKGILLNLEIDFVFFLKASPADILTQRKNDEEKWRNIISEQEIDALQKKSITYLLEVYGENLHIINLSSECATSIIDKIIKRLS